MVTDVQFELTDGIEIISLAKVKKHLRVDSTFQDEDDLIEGYIDAAVVASENFIGGHILEKTMVIKMNAFDSPLVFQAFPLQSITSVKYFPKDSETESDFPVAGYNLTSTSAKVFALRFKDAAPLIADRYDAVTVSVKVGNLPGKTAKPVIQAILLQIADMYERREDRAGVIATAAMTLLRPYKKY
jgi:uncharacterized phiE125 gp8 family phage protein